MKFKLLSFLLLAVCLLAGGCGSSASFNSQLNKMVSPYRFSILDWEVKSLSQEVDESLAGKNTAKPDQSPVVVDYFDIMDQINGTQQAIEAITSGVMAGDVTPYKNQLVTLQQQRDALETQAEFILEAQLKATLAELGIYNPLDSEFDFKTTFPPIRLRLEEPPKLLVISPLDRIERLATITLKSDMSLDDIEKLEDEVSGLNVSALVVDLGGIATYPSFVANRYGLQFALSTAVEEWFHQYLFFRPLGFLYGLDELGIRQSDDIITMNETLAGMVSDEVAAHIYQEYYAQYYPATPPASDNTAPPSFDFNSFMHDTRLTVDSLLAQGQIDQAEAYMESQRQVLASHGYIIRKLNQAFFAFNGSYADVPGFENPISDNLTALRAASASLSDFVNKASSLTNPEELANAVQ